MTSLTPWVTDAVSGARIDVLPDHKAATVTAWLREHPGVEVVCRDGSGAFAQATTDADPTIMQVTDRWQCAMRRLVVSPAHPGGIEGRFLGPMAYPTRKR